MPTKIEWTDETWNPVTGCSKVSQGCKHCYALREWPRLSANSKTVYFGRAFTDVRFHPERLDQPLRWTKPRMIFVNSMSDLFHEDVPDEFIDRVFAVMALAKRHTFQVLTKRPERMLQYMQRLGRSAKILDTAARTLGYTFEFNGQYLVSWPLANIWLGVSIEDQAAAHERIPLLLQTPAAVRWISAEPLLGLIDLREVVMPDGDSLGTYLHNDGEQAGIDWVVVGGESGPNARPMHLDWARSLRDQCLAAGVPYLFKQWGEWAPRRPGRVSDGLDGSTMLPAINLWPCGYVAHDGDEFMARPSSTDGVVCQVMWRVGKKAAGRLLDGALHDDYPKGNS